MGTARHLASRAIFESGAFGYAYLTRAPAWREQCGELAEHAGITSGSRVLDLGCGPGVTAFGMLDRVPDLDVVGLDLSRTMLFLADLQKRVEPRGDRVRFVHGDAARLPFPDASFDAVTGHSFLYLLPDPGIVLAEVFRVLRPGGRCVFAEPCDASFPLLIPPEILRRAPREPRFVLSMALWRFYSRAYGRFDEARFASLFADAGLTLVGCTPALADLALLGVGERPLG